MPESCGSTCGIQIERDGDVTAKDLYEWAKERGVEEYDLVTSHEIGDDPVEISEAYIIEAKREVELY